ncbi:hypothetical protein C6P46_000902 [Rhodotorula mucilaginosa]|uniref:Glutaredoxin domain-containing protein n=1 Tax=Rhodotorula mucilaginosa TaxID=5537 RepID=A0A9P6W833_RHOMI|nr:hypothetical protein C6P46_000902 [Rhodotorula mucilaginosa]
MLSSLTRYARSFFTSAPISQEQAQAAKDTVESLIGSPIAVFSKSYCPYCLGIHAWKRFRARAVDTGTDILFAAGTEAKSILGSHGVASRMKVIELDREALGGPIQQYLAEKAGATKIYIKGQNIGGCSDLKKLQQQGKLKDMLAQA